MRRQVVCGVYSIKNIVNNKIYIGSSSDIFDRFANHKYALRNNKHRNQYLQNSWNKYGEKAFVFCVVEECTEDLLLKKEDMWMNCHDSRNSKVGYNLKTAERHLHAQSSKDKMSKSRTGKKRPKISLSLIGNKRASVKRSEQFKRNLSLSRMGALNSNFGKKHTEETKLKISVAKLGRKHTKEWKQNHSKLLTGRKRGPMSEEQKQKISETKRNRFIAKSSPVSGI